MHYQLRQSCASSHRALDWWQTYLERHMPAICISSSSSSSRISCRKQIFRFGFNDSTHRHASTGAATAAAVGGTVQRSAAQHARLDLARACDGLVAWHATMQPSAAQHSVAQHSVLALILPMRAMLLSSLFWISYSCSKSGRATERRMRARTEQGRGGASFDCDYMHIGIEEARAAAPGCHRAPDARQHC